MCHYRRSASLLVPLIFPPTELRLFMVQRRFSWAESYARMRQLASALNGAGLGLGDTVSVIAANTPEMFEAHFGVPMAGCVLNTINTRLEAETIAYILENSDCQLLIVDTAFHETVFPALASLDPVVRDRIKVVDIRDPQAGDMPHIGDQDYEAFIDAGDPAYDWQMPDDEWQRLRLATHQAHRAGRRASSIITKGAYLMYGNCSWLALPQHPTYLYIVPMFHCNGWCHAWTMTMMAATIVLTREISADAFLVQSKITG